MNDIYPIEFSPALRRRALKFKNNNPIRQLLKQIAKSKIEFKIELQDGYHNGTPYEIEIGKYYAQFNFFGQGKYQDNFVDGERAGTSSKGYYSNLDNLSLYAVENLEIEVPLSKSELKRLEVALKEKMDENW